MTDAKLLLPDLRNISINIGRIPDFSSLSRYDFVYSATQRSQYANLHKKIERMGGQIHDSSLRVNEDAYANFFRAFQAYGSGYADASNRYLGDIPFHFKNDQLNRKSDNISRVTGIFSKTTLAFFVVFVVLTSVATLVAIRGFFAESQTTVEVGIFIFWGGIGAGLGWIQSARSELDRARSF
jgi:hypothetical protein